MNARDAALSLLMQHAKGFPDLSPRPLHTSGLAPRDAALAHAIVDAAVRRWLTLGWLFQMALDRPWMTLDPLVQAALLGGGAQVLFLDRIPAYAAIDASVDWAKGQNPKAAGIVNAGLRSLVRLLGSQEGPNESGATDPRERVDAWGLRRDAIPLDDGTAILCVRDVWPAEDIGLLARATSHPEALVRQWAQDLGDTAARDLCLHSLVVPPITLHTAFTEAPEQRDALARSTTPHELEPACAVFTGEGERVGALLEGLPRAWVQDAASTRAVASVRELAPRIIVDLCAGQGTKTRQLACQFPAARILATDVDAKRLASLRDVAKRFAPTIEVVTSEEMEAACAGGADLVLLDVPCSNTGVLPRRPEARYRTGTDQRERLGTLQREILRRGAGLLAPGGVLLYSTCSIDPSENQAMASWAASPEAGLNLVLVSHESTLPAGLPGQSSTRYRDGAFHARLVREA